MAKHAFTSEQNAVFSAVLSQTFEFGTVKVTGEEWLAHAGDNAAKAILQAITQGLSTNMSNARGVNKDIQAKWLQDAGFSDDDVYALETHKGKGEPGISAEAESFRQSKLAELASEREQEILSGTVGLGGRGPRAKGLEAYIAEEREAQFRKFAAAKRLDLPVKASRKDPSKTTEDLEAIRELAVKWASSPAVADGQSKTNGELRTDLILQAATARYEADMAQLANAGPKATVKRDMTADDLL